MRAAFRSVVMVTVLSATAVLPGLGAVLRHQPIGEINYVRPLDRPGRGWVWQFNLTPAF
ncbi:MAG: hypothetical protein AB7P99_11625 [Vicinamibacterales bacterium]